MERLDIALITSDPTLFGGLVVGLKAANHRVWVMKDCGSALAFLLDHRADVVIVDSELNGIMGLELVPLARKIQPATRIIPVVDEESLADFRQVLDCGIFYHSFKPADQDGILQAICEKRRRENSI